MINTINKILAILNNIEGIKSVIYDNNFSANQRVDRLELPGALLYAIPDWNLDISSGLSKEVVEIQVFFFDKGHFDEKAEEKLPVFEDMSALAKEFITAILNDKDVKVLDDSVNIKSVYARWDKFVVGCTITLKLIERQGSCLYIEPEPEI